MIKNTVEAKEIKTDSPFVSFHKCSSCPYRTKWQSGMSDHLERHRTKPDLFTCDQKLPETFKCPRCDLRSPMQFLLVDHLQIKHQKLNIQPTFPKTYKCKWCRFATDSQLVLNEHKCKRVKKNKSMLFIPPAKNKKDENTTSLEDSEFWFEQTVIFRCGNCLYSARSNGALIKQHLFAKHSSGTENKCVIFNYNTYRMKNKVIMKMRLQTRGSFGKNLKYFQCRGCPFRTTLWVQMKRHALVKRHDEFSEYIDHSHFKLYKCGECDNYKSEDMREVAQHILIDHA